MCKHIHLVVDQFLKNKIGSIFISEELDTTKLIKDKETTIIVSQLNNS